MSLAFCRIRGGEVEVCIDLGDQPVSNGFLTPEQPGAENCFHLAVGMFTWCTMVQQPKAVRRDDRFGEGYPYRVRHVRPHARSFRADVICSANTAGHIADIDSVPRGVDVLLSEDGVPVLEDRDLGDVLANNYFDQVYDETVARVGRRPVDRSISEIRDTGSRPVPASPSLPSREGEVERVRRPGEDSRTAHGVPSIRRQTGRSPRPRRPARTAVWLPTRLGGSS
ncbi:hypothetical protein [Streptomyces sp. NPDC050388]|uniref:hypothetical protein n=1 Tax=Streptomyces sp. NPDC050388 TaxID=3155781 RepID=UPI003439D444